MLASRLASHQFNDPRRHRGLAETKNINRLERERPARSLALRKNILSSRSCGAALSNGKMVAIVLPMPVGACASRHRPDVAARKVLAASVRCPVRKRSVRELQGQQAGITGRAMFQLPLCQARNLPQMASNTCRSSSAVQCSTKVSSRSDPTSK
jgi:hypothetical protein